MNELIKIEERNGEQLVSARELHEFLEVKTRFDKWFNRMIEYGFTENIDYIAIAQKRPTAQGNKTTYTNYLLKISMAKELSMIQRNEKGKQARLYFIECERRVKEQPKELSIPQYLLKQAQFMVDLDERVKENERRLNRLENVKTYIKSNPKMMSITEFAILKGINPNKYQAGGLGTKAKNLSKKLGYEVGETYDSKGILRNIYNVEVLECIFYQLIKRENTNCYTDDYIKTIKKN